MFNEMLAMSSGGGGGTEFTSYEAYNSNIGDNIYTGLTEGDLIIWVVEGGGTDTLTAVSGAEFVLGNNPVGQGKICIFKATSSTAIINNSAAYTAYRYIFVLKQ